MLNIDFQVLGFETVFFDQMGNAIPEVSQGPAFTQRQRDQFKRLARGKRFYISRIRAKGPDGIESALADGSHCQLMSLKVWSLKFSLRAQHIYT